MRGDGSRDLTADPWVLEYETYVPEHERLREALCTLGNGVWATRGAAPETGAGRFHYPGTYKAGVFNRLATEISGRDIENESLVNLPNWLPFTFQVDDGPWFCVDDVELIEFRQALEMDHGILVRTMRFRDADRRETTFTQRRLVHMSRPEIGALETTLRPENWSGTVVFRSFLDGSVENRGVGRYSELDSDHLEVVDTSHLGQENVQLRTRTVQSRIEIVETARTRVWVDGERKEPRRRPIDGRDGIVGQELELEIDQGSTVRVEKIVSLYTTGDRAISEPGVAGREVVGTVPDFEELVEEHMLAWDELWRRFHVEMDTEVRTETIVHLHLFHLLVTTSRNTVEEDVGIPARGLHGEAYRGHIFWDELFVYPLLNVRLPGVARELLRYRYRRLPAARQMAQEAGYDGAMFPWQSGSDGREESQVLHLNPKSGRWIPDESHRQRHINIAIAHNVWRYYTVTGDVEFLAQYGAELLLEIARFWASIATYDRLSDRYHIVGVMGPDEFHDSDPNWAGHALRNNAYTNVMASWVLSVAPRALEPLPELQRRELTDRLRLHREEMERWQDIARKLFVPMHDGIISQFEGYEQLEEFDWEGYRQEYGDIQRLDRILEAEDDTVNRYKASKQADVLMLLYLLSFEELQEVLGRLGVEFDSEMLNRNVEYYLARTSHGSTLSRIVHSWVLARTDRRRSMELFCQALESDIGDIQGGTTEEGIHLGAMAGSVDLALRGYSGLEFRYGVLHLKPSLPDEIGRLAFPIYYRRRWLTIEMVDETVHVTSERTSEAPIQVECRGERRSLGSGETVSFARPRPVDEEEPEPVRLDRVARASKR